MRPRERRETGEQDLFRSRLDQIIDAKHALVKLARTIDWRFLEEKFGAVYKDGPGQPPLPTRLMAGLAILKHTYNLSDEVLCELWIENPYYQYFCGEEFFQHRLPLDRSSMTNWRNRMGEERLQALLQESLSVATKTGAMKPGDLARVIVDTTVQPKNITFPTDAKLLHRAREKLVKLAEKLGVKLRQSYTRVGKFALIQHQRYAHAKQFKRAKRSLRKLKTYLGRVIRDIARKIDGDPGLETAFAHLLSLARRVRAQERGQRGPKVYSLHAPEVECIGKGKAHKPYEFGVKVSVATTLKHSKGGQFVIHAQARPPPRRLQQRHPRRRRLQLPPPDQVAQDSIAPLPGRALRSAKCPGGMKKTILHRRLLSLDRLTPRLVRFAQWQLDRRMNYSRNLPKFRRPRRANTALRASASPSAALLSNDGRRHHGRGRAWSRI